MKESYYSVRQFINFMLEVMEFCRTYLVKQHQILKKCMFCSKSVGTVGLLEIPQIRPVQYLSMYEVQKGSCSIRNNLIYVQQQNTRSLE